MGDPPEGASASLDPMPISRAFPRPYRGCTVPSPDRAARTGGTPLAPPGCHHISPVEAMEATMRGLAMTGTLLVLSLSACSSMFGSGTGTSTPAGYAGSSAPVMNEAQITRDLQD